MNEKIDQVFQTVNNVSNGFGNVFFDSALFFVKSAGKSCGYTKQAVSSVYNDTKRFVGLGYKKPVGLFTGGLRKKFGLNKSEVQAKIAMLENKIRNLYLEIGKIGSGVEDEEDLLATAEVREIIDQIKKLENESSSLRKYLGELEDSQKQQLPLKKLSIKPKGGFEGRIRKRMISAVENCLKKAKFSLRSDAIVFEKSLHDLLDEEMDIKRLAVSEFGKLGNRHAAPVLKEALKLNDPELQAEIINSLIQLEDKEVFNICKSFLNHEYSGIRTACIRGLYKIGQSQSVPLLIEAIKDENVEARNSAAMFLGWLEAKPAVPSLLQAAVDADLRVRKSAILSLANIRDEGSVLPLIRLLSDDSSEIREKTLNALERITGEAITFNNSANKKERLKNIDDLKEWWIKKRHGIAESSIASGQETEQETKGKEGGKKGTKK